MRKLFPLGMLTFAVSYSRDTANRKGAVWGFFQIAKWGECPKVPNVWLDLVHEFPSHEAPAPLIFFSLPSCRLMLHITEEAVASFIPLLIQAGSSRPLQSPSLQWLNRQPTSYLPMLNPSQAQNKSFCCYWGGSCNLTFGLYSQNLFTTVPPILLTSTVDVIRNDFFKN